MPLYECPTGKALGWELIPLGFMSNQALDLIISKISLLLEIYIVLRKTGFYTETPVASQRTAKDPFSLPSNLKPTGCFLDQQSAQVFGCSGKCLKLRGRGCSRAEETRVQILT